MQTLSSVAPPPLSTQSAPATHDIPTFIPSRGENQPLRTVGWVMVIGGAVALALVLIGPKLRSAPAPQQVAVPAPPALPVATPQAAPAQEAPTEKVAPEPPKSRRAKRAAAAAAHGGDAKLTNIRIRARVAPVRATPEPDGKVLCSVKRGALMRSFQQTAAGKGRWFAVHCAKDSPGWVHENFLSVRP